MDLVQSAIIAIGTTPAERAQPCAAAAAAAAAVLLPLPLPLPGVSLALALPCLVYRSTISGPGAAMAWKCLELLLRQLCAETHHCWRRRLGLQGRLLQGRLRLVRLTAAATSASRHPMRCATSLWLWRGGLGAAVEVAPACAAAPPARLPLLPPPRGPRALWLRPPMR
jgi:hypothetical protein